MPLDTVNDPSGESTPEPGVLALPDFIRDFRDSLLDAAAASAPPVYTEPNLARRKVLNGLKRKPFDAQEKVIQAASQLLVDMDERACVINAEMGTGKTIISVCVSSLLHKENIKRTLCIVPPHLVYKWRREILDTVPDAKVWTLNGENTIAKLIKIAETADPDPEHPEFYILGRVRMRMGYHWRTAIATRVVHKREHTIEGDPSSKTFLSSLTYAACPSCGELIPDPDNDDSPFLVEAYPQDKRRACSNCGEQLWTLMRRKPQLDADELAMKSLKQIPTVGPKTAGRLLGLFGGGARVNQMLGDNIYELVNALDENGELFFSDRQAIRIERALGKLEFAGGEGCYQPSEFIKRRLPDNFFGLCIVDEGHEYKAASSAQAEAMAVLTAKAKKTLLLTGTLMGGYADDIFYLLWRINPPSMILDGYTYDGRGTLGKAAMDFMRRHGVIKETIRESDSKDYRTARGKKRSLSVTRAPGFSPQGVMRHVLPYTTFLKLRDIDPDALPAYDEQLVETALTDAQSAAYKHMGASLSGTLKAALAKGDKSLLGLVLNVMLRWPDTSFRDEIVRHPHTKDIIANIPAVMRADELSHKEQALVELCKAQKEQGRRVLVYTIYTGKHDLAGRYVNLLKAEGLKAVALRSNVPTDQREDWIFEQVARGCDNIVCNPELVKTGLDLLDFATIAFMQTGFSVYTLMQASRRSWRIGQKQDVLVKFLGAADTAQMGCLKLMGEKISVAQSVSGDIPANGLESLNHEGGSVEIELAKQLLAS